MCKNKWNAFNSNYKRLANYHKTPRNHTLGSCLMKKLMISFTLTIQLRMLWFHWNISRLESCQYLLAHEGCKCWRIWSLKLTYKKWEWWLAIIKQCSKISNFGCKHWWCMNYWFHGLIWRIEKKFLNKNQPNNNQLLHVINLVDTP
jgi:hypothetical protein